MIKTIGSIKTTNFLPKTNELVVEAEYEFIEMTEEKNRILIQKLKIRLGKLKDANKSPSIS